MSYQKMRAGAGGKGAGQGKGGLNDMLVSLAQIIHIIH